MLLANKLVEKIPDPGYAKKHYQSFLRKKNRKSVKQSEIITYLPKTFQNPIILDIISVITKHPKTSDRLSKTIGKCEKVGSHSFLHSDTMKVKIFFQRKIIKITDREHSFKGYASTYNVEILNSFNPELQLKDTNANKIS